MAQRVIVQDGRVSYTSSDSAAVDMDFNVAGKVSVTKQVNVGDDLGAGGLIETVPGTGVDLNIRTHNNGTVFGNIKLDSSDGGAIVLDNVAWPDGTVSPVPGMYLGVSAVNTLQFFNLPAAARPAYELQIAGANQAIFTTNLPTVPKSGGFAYLMIFVNGVKQIEGLTQDYTISGVNQISFNFGLEINDSVEFYAFGQ